MAHDEARRNRPAWFAGRTPPRYLLLVPWSLDFLAGIRAMFDASFDAGAAVNRLMRFLAVEGVTGHEQAIGKDVVRDLTASGVPRSRIRFDRANERIPLATQTGNLIVTLPGTRPGPRRLFMTHLDTVPLCAGAVPVRKGNRIVPEGRTALGGDNRTGVACLATMLATLVQRNLPHPPLTALFTVREESGLWGARFVDPDDLGGPEMGFNFDGGKAREFTVGAVGAQRWDVEVFGQASHAGVHPERGISATLVTALALAEVHGGGWFGKVRKDGEEGTSNVGSVGDRDGRSAGQATNVVTDYVHVFGESRSHDPKFVRAITAAYRGAFQRAAAEVRDDRGKPARVKFTTRLDYHSFRIKDSAPVVQVAHAAAARLGWEPVLRISNGGLDANWTVRHGIPTLSFGAGQNNIHTVEEYVDVPEFLDACRLALALATQAEENHG
jgi:tripeptide aminopeptidase